MPLLFQQNKWTEGIRETKKSLAKITHTRCSSRLDLVSLAHPMPHACLYHWILKLVALFFFFFNSQEPNIQIKRTSDRNFSLSLCPFQGQLPSVNCYVLLLCLLIVFIWSPKHPRGVPRDTEPPPSSALRGHGCQPQKPQCEDNEFSHFRKQPASEHGTWVKSGLFLK